MFEGIFVVYRRFVVVRLFHEVVVVSSQFSRHCELELICRLLVFFNRGAKVRKSPSKLKQLQHSRIFGYHRVLRADLRWYEHHPIMFENTRNLISLQTLEKIKMLCRISYFSSSFDFSLKSRVSFFRRTLKRCALSIVSSLWGGNLCSSALKWRQGDGETGWVEGEPKSIFVSASQSLLV